jgi:hypothetical protein
MSINNATYGQKGIQLQYNSGTPRIYVGDGAFKSMQFDGTELLLGRDTEMLGASSYNNTAIYFHTYFESIDSYNVSTFGTGSSATIDSLGLHINSGTSVSSSVSLSRSPREALRLMSFGQDLRMKFRPIVYNTVGPADNCNITFGMGNTFEGAFIFFDALAIKGISYHLGGSPTSTTLVTQSAGWTWKRSTWEIIITAGVKIEFFEDGVSRGSHTTNLPTGATPSIIAATATNVAVQTTGTTMTVSEWKLLVD